MSYAHEVFNNLLIAIYLNLINDEQEVSIIDSNIYILYKKIIIWDFKF